MWAWVKSWDSLHWATFFAAASFLATAIGAFFVWLQISAAATTLYSINSYTIQKDILEAADKVIEVQGQVKLNGGSTPASDFTLKRHADHLDAMIAVVQAMRNNNGIKKETFGTILRWICPVSDPLSGWVQLTLALLAMPVVITTAFGRRSPNENLLITAVVGIGLSLTFAVSASPESVFRDMFEMQRRNDEGGLTKPFSQPALQANCDVSSAINSILAGDDKTFAQAIGRSEEALRQVARRLPAVAAKMRFRKPVRIPSGVLLDGKAMPSLPGDEVLYEIARLADQSADALEEIRTRKGSQEELALIIKNNGTISQLIFAFYTAASS